MLTGLKSLRVEGHLRVQAAVGRQRAGRAHAQRVAVARLGLGHHRQADVAAGTGPVVHHHLLAQLVGQARREHAHHGVGTAAGREGHHHAHGLVGVGAALGQGGRGKGGGQCQHGGKAGGGAGKQSHGVSCGVFALI
jgi:hypothetical protein